MLKRRIGEPQIVPLDKNIRGVEKISIITRTGA